MTGSSGRNRARTCDLPRVKRTLSQLSYAPWVADRIPRSPPLTGRRLTVEPPRSIGWVACGTQPDDDTQELAARRLGWRGCQRLVDAGARLGGGGGEGGAVSDRRLHPPARRRSLVRCIGALVHAIREAGTRRRRPRPHRAARTAGVGRRLPDRAGVPAGSRQQRSDTADRVHDRHAAGASGRDHRRHQPRVISGGDHRGHVAGAVAVRAHPQGGAAPRGRAAARTVARPRARGAGGA